MFKVVVDTNVIVSALLRPQSNPALTISLILNRDYRLCLSDGIFSEYEGVLAREKFKHLDRLRVKELLLTLKRRALWVTPKVSIDNVAKDPADKVFLECALETKADFLITGNISHFPVKNFYNTLVVTPSEFMDLITKIIK